MNLFNDLDTLLGHLAGELDRAARAGGCVDHEAVVDAFLLAAGANQVVEDFVHQVPRALDRVAGLLGVSTSATARRMGGGIPRAVAAVGSVRHRHALEWHAGMEELVSALAALTLTESERELLTGDLDAVRERAHRLVDEAGPLAPALRSSVLRLPDCFRSFDQRPEDALTLAERFATRWPDRRRPVLVLGVRTSGSYLAPLQAAAMRTAGFEDVGWATCRPGHPWLSPERARLESLRRRGALVALVDDPPVTGGKLALAATSVEQLGFERASVVLLVSLFGTEASLPRPLCDRPAVVLPWVDWAFHRQLEGQVLLGTLSQLLEGRPLDEGAQHRVADVLSCDVVGPEPIAEPMARPIVRSHRRLILRVQTSSDGGVVTPYDVYVKGCGLGYLGRHSAAIGRAVTGMVPEVYGWKEGFSYRQALGERDRVTARQDLEPSEVARAMVDYAICRAERLAVPEDTSARLRGRHPAWELAANLLTQGLGRWAPAAAPLARRASRSLLRCERPAIVDGSPALDHWFAGDDGAIVKADFEERAFSVWDHACYDVAWDVAGTAASHRLWAAHDRRCEWGGPGELDRRLLSEYQRRSGEAVSPERWVVYQALHLLCWRHHLERLREQGVGQLQTHGGSPAPHAGVEEEGFDGDLLAWRSACDQALACVASRYLADLVLRDIDLQEPGTPCAVAVDEVLETEVAGAAQLTVRGASVLRSLLIHGYRPVLVTHSSLEELVWRCGAYRATDGVARDGAVIAGELVVGPDARANALAGGDAGTSWTALLVDSHASLARLLGHGAGRCPQCREPHLSWESRLVSAALDLGRGARWRLARAIPVAAVAGGAR